MREKDHASNEKIAQFMQAVAANTPHEKARVPSYRMLLLKAQWAERQEKQQRITRVRLVIEGAVQVVVGLILLLLGIEHWPAVQETFGGLFAKLSDPVQLAQVVLATGLMMVSVTVLAASQLFWAATR